MSYGRQKQYRYLSLEGYLNWLADGHAICKSNSTVNIDLRELNGGFSFFKYTISNGRNGTVNLQKDGHVVNFIDPSNFRDLTNSTYSATDPKTGIKFGPVSIGVLITGKGMGAGSGSGNQTPIEKTC